MDNLSNESKAKILKEFIDKLAGQQVEIPEDIAKIVDENFWSLLSDEKESESTTNMNDLTKEQIQTGYKQHMTVRDLKAFITEHSIADDAKILIQIGDGEYYAKKGWNTYKKDCEFEGLSEYIPAWCAVKYHDESEDLLFIDIHY